MKTTLSTLDKDDKELELDDANFDVAGWVEVSVGGKVVTEVHLNELYPAVVGLKTKYDEEIKREGLYESN